LKNANYKNALLIVASLVLIGGVFAYKEYKNSNTEQKIIVQSNATTTPLLATIIEMDSDNDGLKDWEESLWKTDPQKPDTDNDGSKDGDEVSKNRNPLVKGPKDGFIKTNSATSTKKDLTISQEFSHTFFAEFMALKQSGKELDKATEQKFVSSMLQRGVLAIEPSLYQDKDISITEDTSTESLRKYGNDVAAVFKNYAIMSKNEGVIVRDSLEKQKPEMLKELDPIINSYGNILKYLRLVTVPRTVKDTHLELINSVSKLLFSVQAMRQAYEDPLVSLVGAGYFAEAIPNFRDAYVKMSQIFKERHIGYDVTEPGYILNKK
jgi:hypothetical protein